ncbi:hypothetical protein KAR91_20500 [Candidatus Pacearchaeota archaeon]|nr:hypothetical protein [Candidatus Pacearchaeota archaeon]
MEKTEEEIAEETKKTDEEEAKKKAAAADAASDAGEGNESEIPESIVAANAAAKRIEDATAASKVENDRREAAEVRRKLGGESEAGSGPAKKPEDTRTPAEKDSDYADKLQSGSVNPMKDDGYI